MVINTELLDILACPACKSKLSFNQIEEILSCAKCDRNYPIKEGIPVFI